MNVNIQKAIEILNSSGVLLIPTETVYGIAVDATNKSAIEKIYKIKNRDDRKPLQIMVKDITYASKLVNFDKISASICSKYWPGQLTGIMEKKKNNLIASNFNKLTNTVGIRIPDHELVLELLKNFGKPLAVSSANITNYPDSGNFSKVSDYIKQSVDFILAEEESGSSKASTVIDFTSKPPKILRRGSIDIKF